MSLFTLYATILTLLTTCTVFDNDLREHAGETGYYEVAHVETDEYTLDYQFQETTRVLNDRDLSYVAGIDYAKETLYFNGSTPDDVLPKIGQVLHHGVCDELPYGLNHKPTAITREGDLYAVAMERAALNEVFKVLKLDGDFVWGEDSVAQDSTEMEERIDEIEGGMIKVRSPKAPTNYEKDYFSEWTEVDLFSVFPHLKGKLDTEYVNGFADIQGSVKLRFRPILRQKVYLDMEQEKIDARTSIGMESELYPTVKGTLKANINLLKVLKLADKLKGTKPIVPELALFITYALKGDVVLTLSGSFQWKIGEKTYIDMGARYGIPKQKDGLYITPQKKEDNASWGEDVIEKSTSFSVELLIGGEVKVLFGSPTEYPNVGLSLAAYVGPSCKIKKPASESLIDLYDSCVRICMLAKLDGKFFLNIWKHITIDWSYTDIIASLFGKQGGAQFDIPGTIKDIRFFPAVNNTSCVCTNPKGTGKPEFHVNFDMPDEGIVSSFYYIAPTIRIWPHKVTSGTPLLEYNLSAMKKSGEGHYMLVMQNDKLKRDVVYDLEIVTRIAPFYNKDAWRDACARRYAFTTASPTAFIVGSMITAQTQRRAIKPVKNSKNQDFYPADWSWKFRTGVEMKGRSDILEWGFLVGGKKFEVKKKPEADALIVKWEVNESKKSERHITITPYVVFKVDGEEEPLTNLMPSYTVDLTYNPELNTFHEDAKGKYVYSGYDNDDLYSYDVDMTDKKLAPRRGTSSGKGKEIVGIPIETADFAFPDTYTFDQENADDLDIRLFVE